MKTTTNTRSPVDAEKLLKKAKGSMIFGLKAWIKALEMSEAGSKKSTSNAQLCPAGKVQVISRCRSS